MKRMLKLNLQYFAEVGDIMTNHPDSFPEGNDFEARFSAIQSQLQGLGYDIFINNRAQAEFVPISRLNEAIGQRDDFKKAAEDANAALKAMKDGGGISEEAQKKIDSLVEANDGLIKSLKEANTRLAVITKFTDAIDPNDIMQFIDMSKLKLDNDGRVVKGLDEEYARIKNDKPYLFRTDKDGSHSHGGADPNGGGQGGNEKATMNALIRRGAYGSGS